MHTAVGPSVSTIGLNGAYKRATWCVHTSLPHQQHCSWSAANSTAETAHTGRWMLVSQVWALPICLGSDANKHCLPVLLQGFLVNSVHTTRMGTVSAATAMITCWCMRTTPASQEPTQRTQQQVGQVGYGYMQPCLVHVDALCFHKRCSC